MNSFLLAFLLCVACTVMTAMGGVEDWYWLVVSDINVAIWLFVAYKLRHSFPAKSDECDA